MNAQGNADQGIPSRLRRFGRSVFGIGALLLATGAGAAPAPFCLVALPDTQRYSQKFPETFVAQTRWIVEQHDALPIAFVTHLGDVVEHAADTGEWTRATAALDRLDGVVPYNVCLGNHDAGAKNYDRLFGPRRYAGRAWYLGGAPNGRSHAQTFTADGYRFLHLGIQMAPDANAVAWAQGVIDRHAGWPTIVSTHDYLGLKGRTKNGQFLWEHLVRPNAQVFMVLNGHIHGERHQLSTNDAGGRVIEMLSDYQNDPDGGGGFLRIVRFDPASNRVDVSTFSPKSGTYRDAPANRFAFDVAFTGTGVVVNGEIALPAPPDPDAVPGAHPVRFRPGLDGYAGAHEVELRERAAGKAPDAGTSVSVDADEPAGSGGQTQVLLRFEKQAGTAALAVRRRPLRGQHQTCGSRLATGFRRR